MSARETVGSVFMALMLSPVLLPLGTLAAGEREMREPVLPGCGIAYPGGYDVNTVGTVRGRLLGTLTPESGPVRLVIQSEGERWVVLTSPAWFWRLTPQRLAPGDTVTAHGAKTLGADRTLYLIAREIRTPKAAVAVVLRDRCGGPLWGAGNRGGGTPGGGRCEGPGEGLGRGNNARTDRPVEKTDTR